MTNYDEIDFSPLNALADGEVVTHSRVRDILFPNEGPVRWNGLMLWRGALEWPKFLTGRSMVIAGGMTAKVVVYPIAEGNRPDTMLTNWAVQAKVGEGGVPAKKEDWSRPGRFEDANPYIQRVSIPFVNARALIEAQSRGFGNCLMLDMLGNVAEFGNSNVFMAKDGVVYTPVPNGTFLNGITRQRVILLLRADGVTVVEKTLAYADFERADEIFSSGNFAKVAPVIRIDDRSIQPGPFYRRARELYWDFAHSTAR